MTVYPMNLNLAGRTVAVIGGGGVAERKAVAAVKAGALVTIISPCLTETLQRLAAAGTVRHWNRTWQPGDGAGFFLLFCATDHCDVNREAAIDGKQAGALVNVADAPELCDFTVPGQVRRGDLLFTVSTGGKSPAVARQIRHELAERYGEEYGQYLELIGRLRAELKSTLPVSAERQRIWRQAMDETVLELLRAGKFKEAEAKIRNAISSAGTQS